MPPRLSYRYAETSSRYLSPFGHRDRSSRAPEAAAVAGPFRQSSRSRLPRRAEDGEASVASAKARLLAKRASLMLALQEIDLSEAMLDLVNPSPDFSKAQSRQMWRAHCKRVIDEELRRLE